MTKFSTAKKGYCKHEVDEYIQKSEAFLEEKINDLKERICALKEELEDAYRINEEFRKKEERISKLMMHAMEMKENIENEARQKWQLEEDRLSLFREKWTAFAEETRNTHQAEVNEKLRATVRETKANLEHLLDKNLNLGRSPVYQEFSTQAEKEYEDEKNRVSDAKKETSGMTPEEESLKLVSLCKKLGILQD